MTTPKRKEQIKASSATIRAGTQTKLDKIIAILEGLAEQIAKLKAKD